MKRILFLITLFATLQNAKAQTLEQQLQNFPLTDYFNRPIDTLIAHLPAGYDSAFIILPGKYVYLGARLQINYGTAYWVDIGIINPQYITLFRDSLSIPCDVAWPLSLLRKEKVGRISIYKDDWTIIKEGNIF
ncbi:MAG: hypothetical protein KF829_10275 [Ferruginibacter sp.]|nr:hypothetical protein [Ferruginibacter sp.]